MCLENATTVTDLFNESDEITVYKVLHKNMISPYYGFQYKEGENVTEENLEWIRNNIHGGALHVLLRSSEAWDLIYKIGVVSIDTFHVFPMKAKREDFIAEGFFESFRSACFRKLYYEKDQLNDQARKS